MADAHRDQRGADAAAKREGATSDFAGRNASRGRTARRGALRGRRTESGAGICEHGDSRDDQRKSGRAFTVAADGFCTARSAWLFDGRGGKKAGRHREYAESAVVARAAPTGRAAGTAPAENEGRHDQRDGGSRVQLLLKDEATT